MDRDYIYNLACDWWAHPETGCTITGEDMPAELHPGGFDA